MNTGGSAGSFGGDRWFQVSGERVDLGLLREGRGLAHGEELPAGSAGLRLPRAALVVGQRALPLLRDARAGVAHGHHHRLLDVRPLDVAALPEDARGDHRRGQLRLRVRVRERVRGR